PAGVQEGRALEAPPLARQHAVAHQGARLHDAFPARERPGGELPSEQRHVRGDEQEDEGRGGPHAALEIDAAVGPRREHVARDDDRLFPLVAHRRSPVSSITPSASATRLSRTRAPSALRSRTWRSSSVNLRLNSPTTSSEPSRTMMKLVRSRPNRGPRRRRSSDRMMESSFATYSVVPSGAFTYQRFRMMLYR